MYIEYALIALGLFFLCCLLFIKNLSQVIVLRSFAAALSQQVNIFWANLCSIMEGGSVVLVSVQRRLFL